MKERKFINYTTYSDTSPYEVLAISASGKTAQVRPMITERSNREDDVVTPGGFCAHTSHPKGQLWLYESDEEADVKTMTLRKNDVWQFKGQTTSRGAGGFGVLSDQPRKYYDYNF